MLTGDVNTSKAILRDYIKATVGFEKLAEATDMFFNRPGTTTAAPGSFALVPPPTMLDLLRRDYAAMAVMIFGEVPPFEAVADSIAALEATVNR